MQDRGTAGWGCALALGLVAALGIARVAAADGKFGVVDMQRALNECDAGKKAKDQVKAKFERAQDQLKKEREDLDRAREDYEKKAVALSEQKRRDMEKDLDNRSLDFKRKYEDFQRDLKRTDAELTSGIVEQLYAIVADYGRKQGYTMIFEVSNGALLYADKALDVTDEIVSLHDSGAYKSLTTKSKDND
jgi:outer membrane protein